MPTDYLLINLKILFSYNLLDKGGSLLRFGYTVTDINLKPLDQVSGISFEESGVYSFQDFYISNTGIVFLSTKYFDKNKDYKKNVKLKKQSFLSSTRFWEEEANFDYRVLRVGKSGTVQKILTMVLDGAFITAVDIMPKDDGA